MKKIVQSTLAAAILMLATAANATPITSATDTALNNSVLINFNAMPTSSAKSFDMGVVTFNSLTSAPLSIQSYGNAYGSSGQALGNSSGNAFEVVFDTTASAFGILGGAYNGSWTFTAFDVNNNIIEARAVNRSCCSGYFDGIAANGIKRVTFYGNGDYVVFDDFRFTAAQIPEPGSLALLGLGFLGFAASRRKKN
jgi:hypothetical protein